MALARAGRFLVSACLLAGAGSTQAAGASASLHERALALASMTHWKDPVDGSPAADESGWPHVDYCGPAQLRAGCAQPRSVLLVRNASDVDLHDVRVCPGGLAAQQLQLLQADPAGCVHGTLPAHGDLALTVQQRPDADHYPAAHELHLLLGLAGWKHGKTLLDLVAPILRACGSQPASRSTPDDDDFAIGVQERRLTLRSKLVVFTYHGPPASTAVIQARELVTPDGGLQVMGAERAPEVFARHRLPSCSTSADAKPPQVHQLAVGQSCGLVVGGSRADRAPFTTEDRTRVRGSLNLSLQVTGGRPTARVDRKVPVQIRRVVVAGGAFPAAGEVGTYALPVPGLVAIVEGQFHEVPSVLLGPEPEIRSLGLSPDAEQLYFGGSFQRAPPPGVPLTQIPVAHLGVTNAASTALWTTATGPDGDVLAIAQAGELVYVGGRFSWVAHLDSAAVAALQPGDPLQPTADNEHWIGLGDGAHLEPHAAEIDPGAVFALLPMEDGRVLVGGDFTWVREDPVGEAFQQRVVRVANLAAWDPLERSWSQFGGVTWTQEPVYAGVRALMSRQGGTLVGGSFERVGQPFDIAPYTLAAEALGQYRPAPPPGQPHWSRVPPNPDGFVKAIAHTQRGDFVGGRMRLAGGVERVLLRLGNPVGSGVTHDLLVDSGDGSDVDSEDEAADMPYEIEAMAGLGDVLCVGGYFDMLSNGVEAANLACRNLVTLEDELAERGVDGPVYAMLALWMMQTDGQP